MNKKRPKVFDLLINIQDEHLKEIITQVLVLEFENRGTHRFPVKKIEEVVDREARLIEKRNASKNS